MNKSAVRVLVLSAFALCLLILVSPAVVSAMDVDELIAKNIKATGGLEKIKSIKSMVIDGKIMAQGMEIPFTMTQKSPDKLKIEASVMGMSMIQCFAGGQGWATNPMMGSSEAQPMGAVEAKSFALQADMEGPLVDYKKKGYTVKYIGEEDAQGKPAYRISLDNQDGIIMDLYLDKESYLAILQETRMTVEGNEMLTRTVMSDFQEVDGLVMPYSLETRMGGNVVSQLMFNTVVLNQDVDDAVFAMPAGAPANVKIKE